MKEAITSRFEQLIADGTALVARLPRTEYGSLDYWADSEHTPAYHAWLMSAAHLLSTVAPAKTQYTSEVRRLLDHEDMKRGVPSTVVAKMLGLLQSASTEWAHGLMREIEYIVVGAAFDDFLDHAAAYHKGGKKVEASVLASAVFEDAAKRLGKKTGLSVEGKSLEPLIDELVGASAVSPVVGKRLKSYAAVRNHALHAEWDKLDLKDVGAMIQGLRELLEAHL